MANMSYCRFNNTKIDLDECLSVLEDEEKLSEDEFRKCKYMFKNFIDFLETQGIIEDDEVWERLDDYFKNYGL